MPAVVVDSVSDDLDVVAVVVGVEPVAEVVVHSVVVPLPTVVSPGVVPEPLHVSTDFRTPRSQKIEQKVCEKNKERA